MGSVESVYSVYSVGQKYYKYVFSILDSKAGGTTGIKPCDGGCVRFHPREGVHGGSYGG